MTDDERFAMIVSVMGANFAYPRDKRIPDGVPMSAGYTPGVPRLGIPALQSSDASMGVTNPGYRPDDKGATRSPRRSSSARASTRSWRARGARQSPARRGFGGSTFSWQGA
jgi:hypothetical protein